MKHPVGFRPTTTHYTLYRIGAPVPVEWNQCWMKQQIIFRFPLPSLIQCLTHWSDQASIVLKSFNTYLVWPRVAPVVGGAPSCLLALPQLPACSGQITIINYSTIIILRLLSDTEPTLHNITGAAITSELTPFVRQALQRRRQEELLRRCLLIWY